MKEKLKRKSDGRFCDHIDSLVGRIAFRHCLTRRRSRKLLGRALTDDRIIVAVMEYVNRVVTGRGDGMSLVDVGERKEFQRLEKSMVSRVGRVKSTSKKRTKKAAKKAA